MAVALPFIAMGLAVAGGGLAAYSQMREGKAAHQAAKYNAKVAEQNAKQAGEQASFDAEQIRRQRMILTGRQRAAAASSGLFLSGSFTDVIADSAVQGELEAMSRIYEGQVESWNYRAQAELEKSAGKNAATSARLQAYGTIISSLGIAASSFTPMRGAGGAAAAKSAPATRQATGVTRTKSF